MAPKGISTGTLNLRFMQNAARTQEQTAASGSSVAATVAVQDDSRWELPEAAKEGWGNSTAGTSKFGAIQQEASYLPFIFGEDAPSTTPSSSNQTRGRRSWNKKGEEVKKEDVPVVIEVEAVAPASTEHKKLSRISGSGSGHIASARKAEPKSVKSKPGGKTARQALSQSGSTGFDLRTTRKADTSEQSSSILTTTAPATFLRPSGVDVPTAPNLTTETTNGTKPGKRLREGAEPGEKKKKKKAATGDP